MLSCQVPINIDIPAFTIPDKTFPLVALLLPNITNTSLPSLVLPSKMAKGVKLPGGLSIRNISTPNFYGMMEVGSTEDTMFSLCCIVQCLQNGVVSAAGMSTSR